MSTRRLVTVVAASALAVSAWAGVAAAANSHANSHATDHTNNSGGNGQGQGQGLGGASSGLGADAQGPSSNAKFGLCNAALHGHAGLNGTGKKLHARAFVRLQSLVGVATAAALRTFCERFVASFARGTGDNESSETENEGSGPPNNGHAQGGGGGQGNNGATASGGRSILGAGNAGTHGKP